MIDTDFWRGRRVFLTGHTGFKGAWLSLVLLELGAEVIGFALAPETEPSLFAAAGLGERVAGGFGDIRDRAALRGALYAAQPDIVFHLAAQALVRRSYEDPLGTWATNVMGSAHLLESLGDMAAAPATVVVTSDKCYRDPGVQGGCKETDPLGGSDPYSASKAATEILVASWRKSFFRNAAKPQLIATARAGNVVGGGDWSADRLIPDIVAALQAGRPVELRYPDATRPWQHVLDATAGYLGLAQKLAAAEPGSAGAWNFGPMQAEVPVRRIVELIGEAWGQPAEWVLAPGEALPEAPVLRLDSSKAARELMWRPRFDLEAAIRATAKWYRAFGEGKDAFAITMRQIREFLAHS